MRKDYIEPAIEVIRISTQHIMAASSIYFDNENTGTGFLNGEQADNGVEALSRGLLDF